MVEPLHFVHISDTHLGHLRDWVVLGNNPFANLLQVVKAINALPTQPHFVIHTGDVANHDTEIAYQLAAEAFAQLNVPIYYATGNHDIRAYMRRHLSMGPREDVLGDAELNCYRFSYQDERFLVLDSQQPYDEAGHFGKVNQAQLDFIGREVEGPQTPFTVFIHHSPVDLDSTWYNREVGMLNGDDLHRALLPAKDRLRGVFFGHVHRGTHTHRDGIAYTSVGSTFCQLNLWPADEAVNFDQQHPPCFNLVTLHADRTIVKEHTIPRDPADLPQT
ncbi:MAG: hypothetical protein GKR89_15600 [Candidatus Latescibacteria bacterium]|nr:hypothetical protein [Candidatus Latescibacterota bacterium]